MAKKRMLTLEDLVQFCEEQKFYKFSAEESGYQLCVQVPATYEKSDDKSDSSLLFGKVRLLHTGRNRNGSNVTEKAAKKCMSGIAYKPLLANFTQDADGNWDFTSHDMEIDEDGNTVYIEHQIGTFTADKPEFEHVDELDKDFIFANVAIPREYTHAAEIIERKNGTKISAELGVNAMSYDAKNKELILEDIEVLGATCLGIHEDGSQVEEGMYGARLDIQDFSRENNSLRFAQDDMDMISKLIDALKEYTEAVNASQNSEKGGTEMAKENENSFEENLEGTASEEFDTETKKKIEDDDTPTAEVQEQEESDPESESESDPDPDPDTDPESDPESEEGEEPEAEQSEGEGENEDFSVEFSITHGEQVYTFATSLSEQLYALTQLVNDTYAEADNAYYSCDAYADTKEVIFVDYYSGRAWKQKYQVRNNQYSLKGDRVEVHARYLTADEESALDSMKSNYEAAAEKLEKYEAEPQKMEILTSDAYADIAETDEFVELCKSENHFDLSVEEVTQKCDEMLLNAAKSHKVDFAAKEKKPTGVKPFPVGDKKKTGRYGNLFSK